MVDYVEMFDEDAADYVAQLKADKMPTTKDSYGRVMGLLSMISNGAHGGQAAADGFLAAMVKNGYPAGTAAQLRSIMGWRN